MKLRSPKLCGKLKFYASRILLSFMLFNWNVNFTNENAHRAMFFYSVYENLLTWKVEKYFIHVKAQIKAFDVLKKQIGKVLFELFEL